MLLASFGEIVRPIHTRGFAPGACPRFILHVSVHTRERFQVRSIFPGSLLPNILPVKYRGAFCGVEILLPRMNYTHEIVDTHGGAQLCSWSVPLEHVPGAKFLVCIGLKSTSNGSQISIICVHLCRCIIHYSTPFAVHYEKIRIHLCETATNSVKIHSLARKSEHLCINHIQ